MATLLEYFETDFRHTCSSTRIFQFEWRDSKAGIIGVDQNLRLGGTGEVHTIGTAAFRPSFRAMLMIPEDQRKSWTDGKLYINVSGHFDPWSLTKFLSFYVPRCEEPLKWCISAIRLEEIALEWTVDFIGRRTYPWGESPIESRDAHCRHRIFLYHENELSESEETILKDFARVRGVELQLRSPEYALERERKETPIAFISHDSRDKEVALEIAKSLRSHGCPVWYDQFSLRVGDSLRESIEDGIKTARHCILIITPQFLSNTGWTKVEFDSIFTKELLQRKNVVLPIWHNVTVQDVFTYSPSLANRVALDWSLGKEKVSTELLKKLLESDS